MSYLFKYEVFIKLLSMPQQEELRLKGYDSRHTFASRLIESGVDLITVMYLLGHHSVVVTQRYTHSNSDQKKRAVENLVQREEKNLNFVPVLSTQKERKVLNVLFTAN